MLFNSAGYLIFLPVVVILFWLAPFKFRTALLVVASYIFYMCWKPIYGILIFALTLINFFFGQRIAASESRKRAWLIAAIVVDILVLGYFKYTYFAWDVVSNTISLFGVQKTPVFFEILLPLGISFFTFEFIHYLMDVSRGERPMKSFLEFALFASFFPTQIAGPIKRFQDFVPQLHAPTRIDKDSFNEGVSLIIFGLFKKVVLADTIAIFVDRCYAHPELLNGIDLWLATISFTFQVYFDFSGYSDIARGSAKLMGFKVPVNFHLPMAALSVTEFWRRWHLSLGSWLRDYVYIPLGGNKHSKLLSLRNVVITMVICGLWHGAGFHYVMWGLWMGLTLVIHKLWEDQKKKSMLLTSITKHPAYFPFALLLTTIGVTVGLVFFRSGDMTKAWLVLGKMFALVPSASSWWQPLVVRTESHIIFALMPGLLVLFYACAFCAYYQERKPLRLPIWVRRWEPAYLAVLITLTMILSPNMAPQFVYFQF